MGLFGRLFFMGEKQLDPAAGKRTIWPDEATKSSRIRLVFFPRFMSRIIGHSSKSCP